MEVAVKPIEKYSILIIDDEPWALVYLKKLINLCDERFFVIAECQDALQSMEMIEKFRPDVIFTDIRMPDMSGIELIKAARKKGASCEFVILSGFAEFTYAQEAVRFGAFEYILKPLSPETAAELLDRLYNQLYACKKTGDRVYSSENNAGQPGQEVIVNVPISSSFKGILCYVNDNFEKRLYLKEIAQQFHINPNYCCSLFEKATGMSFSKYITDLRMKKASVLLKDACATVHNVACEVGFDDYYYFNKVFKKYYGITPNEYQRKFLAR